MTRNTTIMPLVTIHSQIIYTILIQVKVKGLNIILYYAKLRDF